jgi:hypothetical protein
MNSNGEKIKEIYEKIGIRINRQIIEHLIKRELVPKNKNYGITPDFDSEEEWRITTNLKRIYSLDKIYTEREDLIKIKGLFYLTKLTLELNPSFLIDIDIQDKSISFNKKEVEKIIEKDLKRESWQKEIFFDKENIFTIFDEKAESLKKKLLKETIPLMTGSLGFTEDEGYLMILEAMNHESYKQDLPMEGLISLALKIRGQNLNKKG